MKLSIVGFVKSESSTTGSVSHSDSTTNKENNNIMVMKVLKTEQMSIPQQSFNGMTDLSDYLNIKRPTQLQCSSCRHHSSNSKNGIHKSNKKKSRSTTNNNNNNNNNIHDQHHQNNDHIHPQEERFTHAASSHTSLSSSSSSSSSSLLDPSLFNELFNLSEDDQPQASQQPLSLVLSYCSSFIHKFNKRNQSPHSPLPSFHSLHNNNNNREVNCENSPDTSKSFPSLYQELENTFVENNSQPKKVLYERGCVSLKYQGRTSISIKELLN